MIEILKIFAYTFVEMLHVVPVLSDVIDTLESCFTLKGVLKQVIKLWVLQHFKIILLAVLIVAIILGLGLVVQKKVRKKKINDKGGYYGIYKRTQ